MAELLIRVQDRAGFDPIKNALSSRPGDVIVVSPDGWPWSEAEKTNPDWRIVKLPGVDPASLQDMTRPAYTADKDQRVVAKREKNFDITAPIFADKLTTQPRDAPDTSLVYAQASEQSDVLAAKVAKNTAPVTVG